MFCLFGRYGFVVAGAALAVTLYNSESDKTVDRCVQSTDKTFMLLELWGWGRINECILTFNHGEMHTD